MGSNFAQKLWNSLSEEEGNKRAAARRKIDAQGLDKVDIPDLPPDEPEPELPAPAPAPPSADALAKIEQRLRAVQEAEAHARQEARRAYLALVGSMAPPRTGPAPAKDAHALADTSSLAPVPEADAIGILRAVGRSGDDLRRDVKTWTTLRDQADVAATLPALQTAVRAADAEVEALRTAYEEAKVKWETRIDQKRSLALTASSRRQAAEKAVGDLARAQGVDWNKAARVDGLERVFFPPPPVPARPAGVTVYDANYTLQYMPREGSP